MAPEFIQVSTLDNSAKAAKVTGNLKIADGHLRLRLSGCAQAASTWSARVSYVRKGWHLPFTSFKYYIFPWRFNFLRPACGHWQTFQGKGRRLSAQRLGTVCHTCFTRQAAEAAGLTLPVPALRSDFPACSQTIGYFQQDTGPSKGA